MRNTRRSIPANRPARLAAALLCLVLLAACSQEAYAPVPSMEPTPAATSGNIEPRAGGTMTVPIPAGAVPGNPLLVTNREMSSLYNLVFESLVKADATGAPGPNLAETWDHSEDGLKWTFTLRSGVAWQGLDRKLEAADVVFTLDLIKELGKDKPWGYVTDYLKSWRANEDGTLSLELKRPFYGALQALAFPVLPAGVGYEAGSAPDLPIGTGPYRVVSQKDGQISLTANADWWKKSPWITNIKAVPYPDNATEVSALALGSELDAVQTDDLTVTQYRESGDANLYEYPTRYFEFLAFNFDSPDIQDKHIRQAVAYAIDRLEVVSYTYVNHAIVVDAPVPPDSWLYDGKMLKYNLSVSEAKRLINLSGWSDTDNDGYWDTSPEGVKRELSFTLLTNRDENNTTRNDAAVLMQSQLEKAGIRVSLSAKSWDDYKAALRQKNFDVALCGCYLSPVPDFRPLLGTGGALNVGGYKSEEMDALLSSAMDAPDAAALKVKIGALQNAIIEELPIFSLYFRTHSLLTNKDLMSATGSVAGAREEDAYAMINQWFKPQ